MQHRSACIESSEEVVQAFVGTWCSESAEGTAFPFFGLSVLNQIQIFTQNWAPRTRFLFFGVKKQQSIFQNRVLKQSGGWPIQPVNSLGFSFVLLKKTASGFQPSTNMGYGPRVRMMKLSMIILVDTKNGLYQALIQQTAEFFFAAHHLRSAHYAILFLHFLVRCLFSSVLLLLFLCKAKIKYMSRRQSKYVINKYIVHVNNCQKNGNLVCRLPEILSIFCIRGAFLGGNMVPQKIESTGRKNNI